MGGFVDLDKSIRDPDGATYVQCSLCQVKMDPNVRRPRLNIPLRDHPPVGFLIRLCESANGVKARKSVLQQNGQIYSACKFQAPSEWKSLWPMRDMPENVDGGQ